MYATIENGKFTGTVYAELTQAVIDYHEQYGLTWVAIQSPLQNSGTDEEPDWGSPTFDQLRQAKQGQILQAYESECSAIKAGYPETEILSWTKQEEEARKYIADNTAAVPLITALANERGIDLAGLSALIIQKADAYALAVGTITGKRQRLEKQIEESTTPEELNTISWAE